MMKTMQFKASLVAVLLILGSAPAFAEQQTRTRVGPRGASAGSVTNVNPNASGGYTGTGTGGASGIRGGGVAGQGQVQTNGQGSGTYGGTGSATGPRGNNVDATTSGSGTYQDGQYSGSNTTTVNGNTVNTTSGNGSATVTGPQGNSRTLTRPNQPR